MCAIKTTGRLYCWGANYNGQLGKGDRDHSPPIPGEVVLGAANWGSVSAGDSHTCAVKTNGRLFCWGSDYDGQLGNGGANTDRGRPNEVAGGATNWVSVSAGSSHTCAIKTTGRLYCWGDDYSGQLGDGGANTNRATPVQVTGDATNWIAVTAGGRHTCAIETTGRLFCWGGDYSGELGDGGANTNRARPVQVHGGFTNWASVSAGVGHTCATKTTRRLYCWGSDNSGKLGDGGANTNRARPVQVAGEFTNWASVSAGVGHTCATKTTRRLYCWGSDNRGQLGNGPPNTSRFLPTQVFAP